MILAAASPTLPIGSRLFPARSLRSAAKPIPEGADQIRSPPFDTIDNGHAKNQMLTILARVVSGISVHLLNVLKQLGIATAVALTVGMVIGPSQVVARVAEFSIGRNLHPTWSARVGVFLCLVGLGLLISGMPWMAFVAIALYGAGNGILTIARGTLPLALFAPQGYGARMGLLARPVLVSQACGPIAAAFVLQNFGASALLVVMCGLVLLCFIASWRLPTTRRTD